MTGIIDQINWKAKDYRPILLYKGLTGKARIPTGDLIPKTRRYRNQHSITFPIPFASVEAYMCCSFFRPLGNEMTSLISSPEMSDDCVSKFASLAKARD